MHRIQAQPNSSANAWSSIRYCRSFCLCQKVWIQQLNYPKWCACN